MKKKLKIIIEQPTAADMAGKTFAQINKALLDRYPTDDTPSDEKRVPGSTYKVGAKIFYVIKKGDYVARIAKRFKKTLGWIKKANPQIKDLSKVDVGQSLLVHIDDDPIPPKCDLPKGQTIEEAFKYAKLCVIRILVLRYGVQTGVDQGLFAGFKKEAEERIEIYRNILKKYIQDCPEIAMMFGDLPRGEAVVTADGKFAKKTDKPIEEEFIYSDPYKKIAKVINWGVERADSYIDKYTFQRSGARIATAQDVEKDRYGKIKVGDRLAPDVKTVWGEDTRNFSALEFLALYSRKTNGQFDESKFNKLIDMMDGEFGEVLYVAYAVREMVVCIKKWNMKREIYYQDDPQALAVFSKLGLNYSPGAPAGTRMKESKTSALDKYISENKQLLKEDPYNTPEYDLQRRANSYLTSIAKEMYKVTKPFEEIKKLIDAIPEWVEKQMPDDAWNSLGDLHDLSKINFQKLEIDFNRTVGPGSEVEDTEGQENVAGATDSSLRESLFQEEEREVPTTGGGTQIIDLDTLSDDQRFRAYTILRQNNYEFTDIEQVDYMQMLDDKDPGTLTTGETNYILNNTTMSQETDLESEEAEEE